MTVDIILVTCLSPMLDSKLHERGMKPEIVNIAFLKFSLDLTKDKCLKTLLNKWKKMPSSMFIKTPLNHASPSANLFFSFHCWYSGISYNPNICGYKRSRSSISSDVKTFMKCFFHNHLWNEFLGYTQSLMSSLNLVSYATVYSISFLNSQQWNLSFTPCPSCPQETVLCLHATWIWSTFYNLSFIRMSSSGHTNGILPHVDTKVLSFLTQGFLWSGVCGSVLTQNYWRVNIPWGNFKPQAAAALNCRAFETTWDICYLVSQWAVLDQSRPEQYSLLSLHITCSLYLLPHFLRSPFDNLPVKVPIWRFGSQQPKDELLINISSQCASIYILSLLQF